MTSQHTSLFFTRQNVRKLDAEAINNFQIPGIVLMENASRGLALHAMQMLGWPQDKPKSKVLIICGGGNNGGDGFAAARHLHNAELNPTIITLNKFDTYKSDALTNLNICRSMKLNVIDASADPLAVIKTLDPHDLIIDCIFGTGLTSNVRAPADAVINWLNDQWTDILATDIPSGLDCDTGKPHRCAVKATATVTFVGIKAGFIQPETSKYTGHVIVTDIGAPVELLKKYGQKICQ